MKLPGQCEIRQGGKTWHFYFGIDATAEFLHMNGISLNQFAQPFIDHEMKALLDMFYCALAAGNTGMPDGLLRKDFGKWLDQADEGSMAELLRGYTTSKPLGK